VLTPANCDDRDAAPALALFVEGGVALADLGYRGVALREVLETETELLLLTPDAVGERRALLSTLRERIETTFSQLWHRFIDRVYSRSWNGLWNTIKLKLLHFNLCHANLISA